MGALRMLFRVEMRRHWRGILVLTLLVGFVGAVVLALVAGARRTDTSLSRFEQTSRSADLEIDVGDATPEQLARFARAPGVAAIGELYQLALTLDSHFNLPAAAQVDDRFGKVVDRPRIVAGRAADLADPNELTIGEALADELGIGVGDRLTLTSYSPADVESLFTPGAPFPEPHGPSPTFRVVGIVRRPLDLGGRGSAGGVVVPTPAFFEQYRDQIGTFSGTLLRVRTTHGDVDIPRVARAAREIFGGSDRFAFTPLAIEGEGAQDAIHVATVGLYLAAAIAALTGLVGVGIALTREISLVDKDQLTLSALGAGPRQRASAAASIAVPIAVVGTLLAIAGAVLTSPLFPIGVARSAEPRPGIRVDDVAVAVGAMSVAVAVLVLAGVAGVRTARVTRERRERVRLAPGSRVLADLGAPPTIAAGTRFALDRGRGRSALPVRSSLLGLSFAIAVIVAVAVFTASLDELQETPSAYGWTWDITVGDTESAQRTANDCSPVTTRLVDLPELGAIASVCNADIEIDGRPLTGWGFGKIKGDIAPTAVRGHPPTTPSEVALGASTLAETGLDVGDRVRISGTNGAHTYRIVGQAVFPSLSDPEPLADGAAFTAAGLARLGDGDGGWNLVARLAPGVERAAAERAVSPIAGEFGRPLRPSVPTEIDRVRRIDSLPIAVAAFVALIGLVAVAFALVTATRRNRSELAVLKTLGFERGQVRATVAWQATTVAGIGLLVGVPFGLVGGRVLWAAVGRELGVSTDPTWPGLAVALLVPVVLVVLNLVAAVPARNAARTRPAVVLRSE